MWGHERGVILVVGDVGGTKIDLAIIDPEARPRAPIRRAELPSANYPSLAAAVREFLAGRDVEVDRGCFAVAGPVLAGTARTTNLPWVLEEHTLAQALHLDAVTLLNDLEAIARAVPLLVPADLHIRNRGEVMPGGAIALLAPDTGLGEAYLTREGAGDRAHASEGGNADFAPTTPLQGEVACSGIGMPNMYGYLRGRGAVPEAPDLARCLATAPDPTRLLVAAGLAPAGPDALSGATLAPSPCWRVGASPSCSRACRPRPYSLPPP